MGLNDNTLSFEPLTLPADSNTIVGGGCLASADGALDPAQIGDMEAWLSTRSVATANLPYLASVSTIEDLGLNGYDATQGTGANQGTLLTNEQVSGVPTGLRLPGVAGNGFSRSDGTGFNTTDHHSQYVFAPVSLTGSTQRLYSKGSATDTSWQIALLTDGTLNSNWTLTGGNFVNPAASTASLSTVAVDGQLIGVGWSLDVDNGAGGYDLKYWYSLDLGVTWIQLGTTIVGGSTTSIFSESSGVQVGYRADGNDGHYAAKAFSFTLLDGIDGTALCSPNIATATPYQTTILDTVDGAEWTVAKSAAFTGQDGDGELFVGLPGSAGDYGSCPSNSAINDVLGDFTIITPLIPDTIASGSVQTLLATRDVSGTAATTRWQLRLDTNGFPRLVVSDGTTTSYGGVATAIYPTTAKSIKVTYDSDNGASGNTTTFYTATTVTDQVWTPLGDPVVTAGNNPINNISEPVSVGVLDSGASQPFAGEIGPILFQDGVDGITVWSFTPDALGSTSWVDSVSGQTMTVNQSNYSVARFEEPLGNYTHLPGISGNYVSGPAYIPTGGVTILEYSLTPNDYTPASTGVWGSVWDTSGGSQKAWQVRFQTSGLLNLLISTDGSATTENIDSSAALPDMVPHCRFVVDWDNGTVDFQYSFDRTIWSPLGIQKTFTPIVPYVSSSAGLEIGSANIGTVGLLPCRATAHRIYQDGILVRSYDSADGNANSTTVAGAASEGDYTINSTGTDPTVIVSAPVIRADGTDDFYALNAAITALSQPVTVVVSYRAFDDASYIVGSSGVGDGLAGRASSEYVLNAGAALFAGTQSNLTQSFTYVFNGASSGIYSNGATIVEGDAGANFSVDYLFRNTTFYGNIDFLDLAVFSRVLTDAEILSVTKFFAERANAGITI